ncbi:protein of unknown function [Candidatus Hydrogenisulfobacillus filiaventi]|uniref:Uncharacterized protein n=1 Tax=Candidatus Hydrogenisulfobacillus filiaventi TaxID=2707344 RepID=A0A6F8ZGU0_9FIRM|nr:protein of unknown function [Candidatus Hydrogenisulfobacillus filiaventi]CAB1129227.1 protein of unknown function [Candidatus Hydrogenisulfobacillus filiaventi]
MAMWYTLGGILGAVAVVWLMLLRGLAE